MKDLEKDYNSILRHFFYDEDVKNIKTERLNYVWQQPEQEVRHNFQRQELRNRASICIIYRDMTLAEVERYPKKLITIVPRTPAKTPKGYFATKVLERLLWYRFPDVGIQ